MDHVQIIDFVVSKGVKHVAIKCGADGCVVFSGGQIHRLSLEFDVEAVDATGAGDAFNGGFIHGIVRGTSARDAARIGMALASLKMTGRGAILSLPTREAVIAALNDDELVF